jgi:hypothetical protein
MEAVAWRQRRRRVQLCNLFGQGEMLSKLLTSVKSVCVDDRRFRSEAKLLFLLVSTRKLHKEFMVMKGILAVGFIVEIRE